MKSRPTPLILHVDDYAPARYARTLALRDAGYTVLEATTGAAALDAAREHHPDLVILDVNLPDVSGLEVCRAIKQDPDTSHVLVLHVSATAIAVPQRLEGLDNGADSYLTEPVDRDELLAHVGALLRLRTAERRVRQAHDTLSAVLDAAPLPMVAVDRDHRVVMWNRAAERMFGADLATARGRLWPPLEDRRTADLRARIGRVHETAGFTGLETVASRADGSEVDVSVSAAPLQGNGFDEGVLLIYEDITLRKSVEAGRAKALADAEVANRAKDEFLAVLSHELRTPLNAVLGWIRMLRQGEVAPGRAAHALAVIERNAIAQVRLVEDILDVSRIVSGKLELLPVSLDLLHVAKTAVEAVQPLAAAKHIRVETSWPDEPVWMYGDPSRLGQIAANLLGNAVKFSSVGGTIAVSLRTDARGAELVVKDTGAGIDPAFLPYVFDRFSQGNSTATRSHGGLGLGLAIVRHLVEAHGGTVHAQSAGPGLGSTFTVRLPLSLPAAAGEPVAERPATLQGVRVLVVDDHDDSREMVVELLRAYGAEVEATPGAADALRSIDAFRPDVIVADLGMPGEDGFALLQRIRDWFDPVTAATPVIAVTGYASGEDRVRTARAGFAAHIAKPVESAEFIATIRAVVKS